MKQLITKVCILTLCVVCVMSTASATIVNNDGPTWRGDDFTTYQAWGFDNDNSPADLDINLNPYGAPSATVIGIDPPYGPPDFQAPDTYWKDAHYEQQGVWHLYNGTEDEVEFYVPNNPVLNDQKIIWFQMTYRASGYTGAEPQFIVSPPNQSMNLISKVPVGTDDFFHATWEIIIEPNPVEEWITINPQDCTLYIDEVVIDTICIPEPASIVMLLGTSGLLAFIRRKFIV